MLEMKIAISYGDTKTITPVRLGEGLMGHVRRYTKSRCFVPDVSKDSMRHQCRQRCPLAARGPVAPRSVHWRLRSQARAQCIFDQAPRADDPAGITSGGCDRECAPWYEDIRHNEVRLEKEVRFAQRVQMALLPQDLPKKLKGIDVAWHFDSAR